MLQQDNTKSYLMDCDEARSVENCLGSWVESQFRPMPILKPGQEAVGFAQSCICETTKAFVRRLVPWGDVRDHHRKLESPQLVGFQTQFKVLCTLVDHCGTGRGGTNNSLSAPVKGLVDLNMV